MSSRVKCCPFFFFFNDTATTEIYTLSLHDALPIYGPTPLGYQWQRDSGTGFTNLAGSGVLSWSASTVVSYPNPEGARAAAGNYRLVVTNSSGGTTSQVASLTVLALPAAGT